MVSNDCMVNTLYVLVPPCHLVYLYQVGVWLQGAVPYLTKYKTPMKTQETLSICDLQIVDIYENVRPHPNTGDIVYL